jgi:hypothetical protein
VSPFAVVSACAQAAGYLKKLLPGGQFDPGSPFGRSVSAALACVQEQTRGKDTSRLIPADLDTFLNFYHKAEVPQQHLQRALTRLAEEVRQTSLAESMTPVERAGYLSARGKWASAAFSVAPSEDCLQISSHGFRILSRLRLGASPLTGMVAQCACGESFVQDPAHSLNCNKLKASSITDRHDSAVQAYANWARRAGAAVTVEKRVGGWPSRKRYDAVVIAGTRRYAVDFVVTNAAAPSNVTRAQVQGGAANHAATRKVQKYRQEAQADHIRFRAMSIELLGHWDREAVQHVREIAAFCGAGSEFSAREVLIGLRDSIAVAVARGIGYIIMEGQQRAIAAQNGIPGNN